MSDFRLTEGHIYKHGDRVIPGVTETIQANFGNRPYWDEWKAGKGKAVHLAIHYLVQGRLNWDTVDEQIRGRVEAFQKFLNQTRLEVIESELQMFSNRYQFGGTMDLLLSNGSLIVADIKSHIEPTLEIQLGAYSLLYEENFKKKIKKAVGIQLKDNGSFDLKWYKDITRIQRIFLACLTVANWNKINYPQPIKQTESIWEDLPDSASWPEFD